MEHIKLFEGFLNEANDFHLTKFIDKPEFVYWLSPGPMKISNDNPHEDYSFDVKKSNDKSIMEVPSDKDIKKHKESRKGTLKGIESGKTAWWTPGGYHFGIKFKKTDDGNTSVKIGGRPSDATGYDPVFKEYELKGWDKNDCETEAKKYTYSVVRELLNDYNGKEIKYDK